MPDRSNCVNYGGWTSWRLNSCLNGQNQEVSRLGRADFGEFDDVPVAAKPRTPAAHAAAQVLPRGFAVDSDRPAQRRRIPVGVFDVSFAHERVPIAHIGAAHDLDRIEGAGRYRDCLLYTSPSPRDS